MKKLLPAALLIASGLAAVVSINADSFLTSTLMQADRDAHDKEYFDQISAYAQRTKEDFPWGGTVPEREFKYFVLIPRINNEALDTFRMAYYDELRQRVQGLNMKDAILEINHWAHEKATYQPSDARTSTPLSTISQAIGRCGEESTLLVAALRTVGIPARQVYTPRWAHTNDNHAWVEAWADGKWYFLGACEPEPVLNMAWFNAPAARGMLMHTNVFSPDYDGPEDVIARTPLATTINVTSNYAPVRDVAVKVTDAAGNPLKDVNVSFCIYNYAEYFPAVTVATDENGMAHATAGIGDMIIWATDGHRFNFTKHSPSDSLVTLTLDKDASYNGVTEFDIVPPRPGGNIPDVTAQQVAHNEARKQYEDSVRMAYVSTFCSDNEARAFADSLGLDPDDLSIILTQSRGNHKMLRNYLREKDLKSRTLAIALLKAVSEKDRRDISRQVLDDNILFAWRKVRNIGNYGDASFLTPLFVDYILNPRIELEPLTPWRRELDRFIPEKKKKELRRNPALISRYVESLITTDPQKANYGGVRSVPSATLKGGTTDPVSRNIFYVAVARTLGIPARIDPVTSKTQYADASGEWQDVKWASDGSDVASPKGELTITGVIPGVNDDHKYYSVFALSKIENGRARHLEFDENTTLVALAAEPLLLDAGQYAMTSGQRMADGSVLARTEIFTIADSEQKSIPYVLRQDSTQVQVIGAFNSENKYFDIKQQEAKSLLSTTGRGYYVLAVIRANHEPSAHFLNELTDLANAVEQSGRKFMLILTDASEAARWNGARYSNLPKNAILGYDIDGKIAQEVAEEMKLLKTDTPLVIIADTFNRVVFSSQGYSIGLAQRLLDILNRVE